MMNQIAILLDNKELRSESAVFHSVDQSGDFGAGQSIFGNRVLQSLVHFLHSR